MLTKIRERKDLLFGFIISSIGGFFLSSGNLFTYFNYDYRGLLLFNLQYLSTVALIYFAWRQYRFTQLEHANAEFKLLKAEIAFASMERDLENNDLTGLGPLVSINCKIKNIGSGYAELLDFEDATLTLRVEKDDDLFSIHWIDSNFSKQINSRIAPEECLEFSIEEFAETFRQRKLNEKIDPDKGFDFERFQLEFFSDKDRHSLSTEEIEIKGKKELLNLEPK